MLFLATPKSQCPTLVLLSSAMLPQQEPHSAGAPLGQNLLPLNCKQEGSPSCGIKVQRGGRKTLRPFEFFQIMFGSLRRERSADSSTVMSTDTFAHGDHTRVHDIRPIFTCITPIKSFYLPRYPPTSKECAYQSFTDRRLVAFCYSRCLIQDFSHLSLHYGPTSCILNKEEKKGIGEEEIE